MHYMLFSPNKTLMLGFRKIKATIPCEITSHVCHFLEKMTYNTYFTIQIITFE